MVYLSDWVLLFQIAGKAFLALCHTHPPPHKCVLAPIPPTQPNTMFSLPFGEGGGPGRSDISQ